jgi:pimeloyl-ACP methyl ester carboxylesterase
VLFVHGAATSGADWLFALPLLRDRFTIVTIDRRGRGASADAPAYALEREAEDILAVLDEVGGELLVAHSYGALCAIRGAELTDRLRRLVLYEPPVALTEEMATDVERVAATGEPDALIEGFLRSAGTSAEQFEAIRASPAWPALLDAAPAVPRELRAAASEWSRPAEPIDVPTLLLLGAETTNPVYLEGLDELQACFPDSRRELIPDQLHVAHVFAAEAFAGLVADFLAAR